MRSYCSVEPAGIIGLPLGTEAAIFLPPCFKNQFAHAAQVTARSKCNQSSLLTLLTLAVANIMDGLGTTRYAYDAAGQLLTEDGPFTSDTVTNTYSNRKRLALRLQQPTGAWTNGFRWDLAGRLTNVTSAAGPLAISIHEQTTCHCRLGALSECPPCRRGRHSLYHPRDLR